MTYTSDKRLWLTADGRVVDEGDEAARTLLVGAGCELPDEVAAQYGLSGTAPVPEVKAVAAAPANKAVSKAPANKQAKE